MDYTSSEFDILEKNELQELMATITDSTATFEQRNDAKNRILLAFVRKISGELFVRSNGPIGVSDHSDLRNSFLGFLKGRMTALMNKVDEKNINLTTAVMVRLDGWVKDKIRKENTQRHGGNIVHESSEAIDYSASSALTPEEQLVRDETVDRIKAAVFDAVKDLAPIEQQVVFARFKNGHSIKEVADLLDVPVSEVVNANRRARAKLSKWLGNEGHGHE